MLARFLTRGALALAAVLALGCAASPTTTDAASDGGPPDDRPQVVASMNVIADLAERIAGDRIEVTSLVPVGGDPHVHEPTPSDARTVADADLLLANGVGLEPWFDSLAGDAPVLRVAERLTVEVLDDEDGEPDPHLWMVPDNAAVYGEAIAEELAELDEELAERLAAVPDDRRILITPHDAYAYFADHYGFEVATIVGVSTEEEPSAAAVQRVIDLVREREIPTVFVEFTVNPAVIERVATDAGAEVGEPLYGDSLGPPGSGADDYAGMQRANVEAIVGGLAD